MIARLVGRIAAKAPDGIVVDVHGVGYHVLVSLRTLAALPETGAEVTLAVHTHLRENALELFGFVDDEEKRVFTSLLSVSGVGPRLALNLLSRIPAADLAAALAAGDVARLTRAPGVGRKTAERLVVELQDRVRRWREEPRPAGSQGAVADAVSALVNLGYRPAEADAAVRAAVVEGDGDAAALIRRALKRLGP